MGGAAQGSRRTRRVSGGSGGLAGSQTEALLASEMGANQGNWIEDDGSATSSGLPSTEYTAARFLAYRVSQRLRNALRDDAYASFFQKGEIGPTLAAELVSRYRQKRTAQHNAPDVGDIGPV